MSRRKYEEEIREKLKELEGEIDRLHSHIKSMEDELDDEHHKKFAELRELQQRTQHTFSELLNASDEAFDSVQSKMEQYWSSLGREIKAYDEKLKS